MDNNQEDKADPPTNQPSLLHPAQCHDYTQPQPFQPFIGHQLLFQESLNGQTIHGILDPTNGQYFFIDHSGKRVTIVAGQQGQPMYKDPETRLYVTLVPYSPISTQYPGAAFNVSQPPPPPYSSVTQQSPVTLSVPDDEDDDDDGDDALKDTPACTIVVHGVSGISCLDLLEMYFESKKRSGGDEISSIKKDDMDSDVLYITYGNEEVVQRVLNKTHTVEGHQLQVTLHEPTIDATNVPDPLCTVVVSGVSKVGSRDLLELYFESKKRSGGGEVEEIRTDDEDEDVVYIKFTEETVAQTVASRSHNVNGETLKASLYKPQTNPQEQVGTRRTISIHMDTPLAVDTLEMYFESQKRSGGGEIESVDIDPDDPHTAYVTFMEQDVLTSVLERCQHRVNEQILQVELYIPEPLSKTDIKQKKDTEQKQSQDKEEKEPSSTVKVTGISKEVSLDTVVYFFENKLRSGGGEILKYWQGEDNPDTCFITYVNAKDAQAVSENSPHIVSGQEIRATLYRPLPTYTDRVLIKGLSSATTQDCLFNYLEAKVQAVPVKMVHGTVEGVVLVTFKEDPDFAKLLTISGKPLEGSTLTLSPVSVSNCIYVSNIGENTSRDTLLYYFENTRQSGGGEVEKIVMKSEENAAVVYFKEYHTTVGVLSKQEHKIDGQKLAVEIYLELLGCTKKHKRSQPELKIPKPVTITRLNVQKLRFLQATPAHKQSLEQLMTECHGHIQWHVNKQEVKIECTLTSEVKDCRKLIIDWEKTVEKCFQDFFKTIIVKDIPVSASTMNDVIGQIRDMQLSTSESVSMMIDKEHCLFRVVGIGPNVVEAAEKVQATIKSVNKEKSDMVKQSVTTLKPIQTKMLVSNKFTVKCKERFPNLKVVIKQNRNEIMFEGAKTDVTEGKLYMHQTVNTFATAKLPDIPKDFAHLYNEKQVREHIIRMLKSQNLVAVWEMSLQTNELSICAPNDDTLDGCVKTIRNTLVEKQVQLTKENRYVVQTQNWIDQVQHWQLQFSGRICIRVDELDKVMVCSTDDIVEQLTAAVEDFISANKIGQEEKKIDVDDSKENKESIDMTKVQASVSELKTDSEIGRDTALLNQKDDIDKTGHSSSLIQCEGNSTITRGLSDSLLTRVDNKPLPRLGSKPVTNVTFTTDRYVEIQTLHEFENEEKLKLALLRPGFPVLPPVIVFAKELKRALLICCSEQDAIKLCMYERFKDLGKPIRSKIKEDRELIIKTYYYKGRYTELKDERRLELIQKLEEAQVKLFTGDNCRLEAPTLCQLSYGQKLLEQFGVTENETGRPHSECEIVITFSGIQYAIFKDILEKDGSKVVEKFESINVGDNTVSVTIGQQLESFKDRIIEKEKFVKELSFDEVPCSGSMSPEQINQFIQDIEADNSTSCCLYDRVQNRCIVYHESYEVLQKVKYQLSVKMSILKPIARRKRDFTNVAENVTTVSSDSKPKFDWVNDAKNVGNYNPSDKISISVYEANILKLPVDCIVNAANDILQHGGGVALVIARAAGKELDKECRDYKKKHGPVPVGQNCVTTAGKLPYKCVIHAVGPRWSDYKPHDLSKVRQCERDLYDAIYESLHSAEKERMKSIALPPISTAIFGVPEEICVYQYAKATLDYCRSPKGTVLQEIHFVDIKPGIIRQIQNMFDMMVNDHKDPGCNVEKFVKSSPPRWPDQSPRTRNVQYRTSVDRQTVTVSRDDSGHTQTDSRSSERAIPVHRQTKQYPFGSRVKQQGARSKYAGGGQELYETTNSIEKCVICMDTIDQDQTALNCGHRFCTGCIEQQFKHKKACPTCGLVCGIITGDQPYGTMDCGENERSVAGFENCGSIWIAYSFPSGRQESNHPNPGRWYIGITRVAYLPDNKEGREVCKMLEVAFKRKLVFTIGYSRITGQDGVITWNNIHHKTDPKPNTQYGYPDPTYLDRVRDELAVKGVTPADIEDSTT